MRRRRQLVTLPHAEALCGRAVPRASVTDGMESPIHKISGSPDLSPCRTGIRT